MNVYLNEVSGLWQAIAAMYISKRTWTRELELDLLALYERCFDQRGAWRDGVDPKDRQRMVDLIELLFKWSKSHITLGRYLDFAFTVEGIHRGAQDDFDSHAKRLDNRIIRSSTRLAKYGVEKSDWYKDRIITTDEALSLLGESMPQEIMVGGQTYVRAVNGYVREDLAKDRDTLRGLYMLSIPSTFSCKVNITEFAHIYKERGRHSHAAPELRLAVEQMVDQVQEILPQMSREWLMSVKN